MQGIYIHIPFCKQACHYCDFHFSTSLKPKDDFIGALIKETRLRKDYLDQNKPVNTIYLGGGTPSLLDKNDLERIFNEIGKTLWVDANAEITLEANPDDLTVEKLQEIAETPVNRLSIGVQSFDDAELKWMNRVHNSSMALKSVKDAKEAGFENISLDLIYGSPLLTNDQWLKNLELVAMLDVQHLSCYNLTVEHRTALAALIKKGASPEVNSDHGAEQFTMLMDWAPSHGFDQYEISNFSKEGFMSRHNSSYWDGYSYLGLGSSAHSFNGISRQWNISNNQTYIREINRGHPSFTMEILTPNDLYNEYIMTALRTSRGVDKDHLVERIGTAFNNYFQEGVRQYISNGWVEEKESIYTLTGKGKLFADRISADLFMINTMAGNK